MKPFFSSDHVFVSPSGPGMHAFMREAQKAALVMMALLAWLAFANAALTRRDLAGPTMIAILLLLGTIFGGLLYGQHPRLTSLIIIASLCGAYASAITAYPHLPMRYLGVLIVIICSTMLSDWAYLALTAGLCLILIVVETTTPTAAVGTPEIIRTTVFLLACSAGLIVARRHLAMALRWSNESAQMARQLNDALRERQLSLNRALRSMEEATWRIERLNNELILARHDAEAARAAKERFASTVSHEIRGPLNLILGFSQLMALSPERYGANLTSAFYADADTIYRNTQHLCNLVDDVLDLSRIEAEHLPIVRSEIDIHQDVIDQAVESIRPLVEHKGLYLQEALAQDVPHVLADPVRLRQVLLNLLINSLRFTKRGGITVRSVFQDGELIVSVEDTGPGIAEEDLPKLFKEFQQLYIEGGQGTGSGLGLSIAKHLVEAHGGRIWAESALGKGTAIRFALPPLDTASRVQLRRTTVQHRTAEPDEVVVVHPDPEVVSLLHRYLEGYRVVGTSQVAGLGELVERLRPRAVLIGQDIERRVIDEMSVLPYDVPIISCGLPQVQNRNYPPGIIGYLVKPVYVEALQPFIRRVSRDGSATILLVDDDPDEVRLLEIMIESMTSTYEVIKAYDGLQALALMRSKRPDIAFVDWLMPGLDGMETIARMNAEQQLRDIPVVIVSARDPVEAPYRIQMPLTVHSHSALPIANGASCLRSLLSAIRPNYLDVPEPLEQPVEERGC